MASPITIAGLGPGSGASLGMGTLEALRSADQVWLRTRVHPTVALLEREGLRFRTFDDVYEGAESLTQVYETIRDRLLEALETGESVVYAVPGHPLVAESSTELLLAALKERGLPYRLLGGESFVDACLQALELPLPDGLQLLDAQALPPGSPDPALPSLLYQVDDRQVASDLKLRLLERYPETLEVVLIRAAGVPGEQRLLQIPLVELDRQDVDHLTSVYVPAVPLTDRRPDWPDLVEVVRRLRAPGGCPWDREQTHSSIRKYLLEESYEAIEAIDLGDDARLCDELGDVLLQVLLHSQMAAEEDSFTIRDVIEAITQKMIRRHPHVFGDVEVADAEEVLANWDQIKAGEKGAYAERKSVLDGIPRELPALMKALEVSKRAVKVGFEWPDIDAVWDKVREEWEELRREVDAKDTESAKAELGDLLFTLVNIARWMKIDPEDALRTMVARFTRRFQHMEREVRRTGRHLSELTLDEMETLWQQAKVAAG